MSFDDRQRRHRAGHHRPRPDQGAFADGDAGVERGVGADRGARLDTGGRDGGMIRVRPEDHSVGAHLYVIVERHARADEGAGLNGGGVGDISWLVFLAHRCSISIHQGCDSLLPIGIRHDGLVLRVADIIEQDYQSGLFQRGRNNNLAVDT